jgi:hypothetical protein
MVKIVLNMSKKYFIGILLVLLVLGVGSVIVLAQLNGAPNPGHLLDCVKVEKSSSGDSVTATCPNTRQVTGCASACRGGTDDSDLTFNGNGCTYSDSGCTNNDITVRAMCCRVKS